MVSRNANNKQIQTHIQARKTTGISYSRKTMKLAGITINITKKE